MVNYSKKNILIILIIIGIFILFLNYNFNENFYIKDDGNEIISSLNKRIDDYHKYPLDKLMALRPVGITDYLCDICVYKDNFNGYKFGDFIKKNKNESCPEGTEYMNLCKHQ
jgi:hypothetical protein